MQFKFIKYIAMFIDEMRYVSISQWDMNSPDNSQDTKLSNK